MRTTAGLLLVLVLPALGMVGCKPVEWSELGSRDKLKPASQSGEVEEPSQPSRPREIRAPSQPREVREPSQPREVREPSRPSQPTPRSQPSKSSRKDKDALRIVAVSNREVARLSPEDIIRVMQRVGFSDDQILELGPDLHKALLLSGGAELFYGKRLEMLFAVNNQQIQIQSRLRGTFVYDIVMQRFILGSAGR